MKKIFFLIAILLSPISVLSQEKALQNKEGHNTVSKIQYQNFKVKGIYLGELQSFKGEVTAMEDLFGMSLSVKIPDPEVRTFYNSNILFDYGDATEGWVLYYIEISSSVIPLEILGKNVKIGDDISTLGLGTNLKSLPIEGGKRSAVFVTPYDTSFIGIHFEPITRKITKIEYLSPT